jgi:uncharacterized caspase-like protein
MRSFSLLVAIQVVLAAATFAQRTAAEERVALVIGNSAYSAMSPVRGSRGDAEAVADALRAVGFQTVTLETDVTKEKLVEALQLFARKANEADWAVFYFVGHGAEINGVNYLMPVDAKLEGETDPPLDAVTLKQVLAALDGARALRIVLLDASRDNPFARIIRRGSPSSDDRLGFPKDGTLIVYATKHGETVVRDGGNSPFATALAKLIKTPGKEIRALFDSLRDDVSEATRRRQQPSTYGSLPGRRDFYFATKN